MFENFEGVTVTCLERYKPIVELSSGEIKELAYCSINWSNISSITPTDFGFPLEHI